MLALGEVVVRHPIAGLELVGLDAVDVDRVDPAPRGTGGERDTDPDQCAYVRFPRSGERRLGGWTHETRCELSCMWAPRGACKRALPDTGKALTALLKLYWSG